MLASPASSQSITDRFKSLFGAASRRSPPQGAPPAASDSQSDLTCPPVSIRAGASTYAVAAPGKQPVGNDLRFQATITRTARDCTVNGGEITARIGIQGRVIAGPAGAPPTVEIPLRVAVVQGGVQEKTIATKVYRTTVSMTEAGSVPFSLVAEDRGVSGAAGSGRRFLHLLYRLRSAGAEAGAEGADVTEEEVGEPSSSGARQIQARHTRESG